MCIIAYKPTGAEFPTKRTLQACFNNNPDGAGFMVASGNEVYISKGYMGFRSFWKALRSARETYGDDKAYVMHFRISTQGGVRADCCHPFPLSRSMSDLRKLETTCGIGIAHNGIISLTSTYSYKNSKKIDYSDTMSFISEYLTLIINSNKYYKRKDTLDLITKLCESRLAILDKFGHCELIGSGWIHDGDMYYSNDSYFERLPKAYSYTSTKGTASFSLWDDYDDVVWSLGKEEPLNDYVSQYDDWYDEASESYDFCPNDCPATCLGDESFCDYCKNVAECFSL